MLRLRQGMRMSRLRMVLSLQLVEREHWRNQQASIQTCVIANRDARRLFSVVILLVWLLLLHHLSDGEVFIHRESRIVVVALCAGVWNA